MKIEKLLQDPKYTEKFVLQKLLCALLNCTREDLWTDVDREVDDEMVQKIILAYDDYTIKKKPLEYVLGHVDFFGNEFIVNEATLIPRPETEYMINSVTEFIHEKWIMNNEKWGKLVLLDIGTGCGVLGISVLLQNTHVFGEAVFTDYFANALEIAKQNLAVYKSKIADSSLKVEFVEADLLSFIDNEKLENWKNKGIILVANLPYIPEEAFDQNAGDNVKNWEPKPAFVGVADGLIYYRKMFDQIFSLSLNNVSMFLEMMTRQVDVLRQEFGDRLVFEEVKTFHFNIRIVKAWLK